MTRKSINSLWILILLFMTSPGFASKEGNGAPNKHKSDPHEPAHQYLAGEAWQILSQGGYASDEMKAEFGPRIGVKIVDWCYWVSETNRYNVTYSGLPGKQSDDTKNCTEAIPHRVVPYATYNSSQWSGREDNDKEGTVGTGGNDIIEGAHEEDQYDVLTDNYYTSDFDASMFFNHFWEPDDYDSGDFDNGLFGGGSSVVKAERHLESAVDAYRRGPESDPGLAYHFLGRVVHLLEDASSIAHVHNDPHPPRASDEYEDYMGGKDADWDGQESTGELAEGVRGFDNNYIQWTWNSGRFSSVHLEPVDPDNIDQKILEEWFGSLHQHRGENSFGSPWHDDWPDWAFGHDNASMETATSVFYSRSQLFRLFYSMAETADDFPSDDYNGDDPAHDGDNDIDPAEDDNDGDVAIAEVENHADVLMPAAMEHVAGLYMLFWNLCGDINDDFGKSKVIEGISGYSKENNRCASHEIGEPNHAEGGGERSIWWQWTATQGGLLTLKANGFALGGNEPVPLTPILAVYTGDGVDTLTEVESTTDGVEGLSFFVQSGETYAIVLDTPPEMEGDLSLRWKFSTFNLIASASDSIDPVLPGGQTVFSLTGDNIDEIPTETARFLVTTEDPFFVTDAECSPVVAARVGSTSTYLCPVGAIPVGESATIQVECSAGSPEVSVNLDSPNSSMTLRPGQLVTLRWSSAGATESDMMTLSMKRDSVPSDQALPDGVDWIRWTESTSNDGVETVTIPLEAAIAGDWRFYVKHNESGAFDGSDTTFSLTPPGNLSVTMLEPDAADTHFAGGRLTVFWTSTNASPSDLVTLSIKRDSVAPSVTIPDQINWLRFSENLPNSGSAVIEIPTTVASASDWRFYVRHNSSEAYDGSDFRQTITGGVASVVTRKRNKGLSNTVVTTRVELVADELDIEPGNNIVEETTTIWSGVDSNRLIDIKPGSSTNPINPRSRGKTTVAILGNLSFNPVSVVDTRSLTFGRTGFEASLHYRGNGSPNCSAEDVDSDGFDDLVCHFHTQIAAFQAGDTEGLLIGYTTSGASFVGRDTITLVGQGHDDDADGVEDDIEDAAPNFGDGNGDGISDSAQLNVTSLPSAESGTFITLVAEAPCVNSDVRSLTAGELPQDVSFQLPHGALAFRLTGPAGCGTSKTRIFFHGEQDLTGASYRKLLGAVWSSLPEAEFGQAEIDGALVATVDLPLVDGGTGDSDGTADGVITDPGGPAILRSLAIPSQSQIGLILLSLLLALTAAVTLNRRH